MNTVINYETPTQLMITVELPDGRLFNIDIMETVLPASRAYPAQTCLKADVIRVALDGSIATGLGGRS